MIFCVAGVFALVALSFCIVVSVFIVPSLIGWQQYPESMLIDMALKAVA